jgi:hypothetical protein
VGRETVVAHELPDDAEARSAELPGVAAGMRRQHGDGLFEDAGVDEVDLAAARLLRGSADELDTDLQILGALRGEKERADVRHRDEVVPAGVSDLWKCVVLRQERNGSAFWSDACAKRRLEPSEIQLDVVTVSLQQRGDVPDRLPLLVRQLGCPVDGSRQDDEIITQRPRRPIHRLHAAIPFRSEASVATRSAAAASASVVMTALS